MPSTLFSPFTLRSLAFRNRVFVSPMCQYSSENGMPTDWHLVHLGSRAVGGAGCVIQEATAVLPEGRISPEDAGIWNDEQADAYKRITAFIKQNGAVPGIQLAHAGRKASVGSPWSGLKKVPEGQGGWPVVGPSAVAFEPEYPEPREMTLADIQTVIDAFVKAAERSLVAGFEVAEVHAAHGYLLHEFLSALSNKRTDEYGGSLDNRMRLVLQVSEAVRKVWPDHLPVFVRLSASDWVEGGWDLAQSITLSHKLKALGIDLIDASSGGNVATAKIPLHAGYQLPFAEAIKKEVGIATGAVGLITSPEQAEQIVTTGQADVVLLARALLADPYWPLHAAPVVHGDAPWPQQYERAKPR